MKSVILFLLLALPALCDPAAACRCEERTLGEYFADADEVAVGRLVAIEDVSVSDVAESAPMKLLRFELTAVGRLNYIPTPRHGFVWPSPGAGLPTRTVANPGQREVPIEVLEEMDLGGSPWLRINVLGDSPCEAATPRVRVSGWIPAWGPVGEPVVWFYSRGC